MKRLPRIAGAYLASSVAAGLTIALLVVVPAFVMWLLAGAPPADPESPPPSYTVVAISITIVASAVAAGFALVPAAVMIALAETRQVRSATFYASAGVVAGVVAWCILNLKAVLQEPGLLLTLHIPFLAMAGAAGLVAGLVYWRIAGRTAGVPVSPRPRGGWRSAGGWL